jgi:hypothetical protein
MKKLVLIIVVFFSLWVENAYAVSVCPTVFWDQALAPCQTGEVSFGLRICPNDEANPNIIFHHVEWNFGDGTVISNSSMSTTYTYTTGGTYHAVAEVYFMVDGTLCSTIAKHITSQTVPGAPWFSNFAGWFPTNIFVDQCVTPDPLLLEDFMPIVISIMNADLWISPAPPYSVGQVIDIHVDIANLGSGEVINYTLSVDNTSITSGMYSSSGLQTAVSYTIPAFLPGQTATSHVIELNGVDPKRPGCPVIRTVDFEILPEEDTCDVCLTFRPDPNKRYWVSAWVKVINSETVPQSSIPQVISYDNGLDATTAGIQLEFIGSSPSTIYFRPSGDIIEGWQRIAGEFTTPNGATEVNIKLVNPTSDAAYFDDVRIHPFNGSMKSYVNDPETFWLTAELDDNNYATFYEYDMEGKLIRIKKETEKGIVTIKENRSSNPKTN